jgi:chromosome partitioning protein
MRAWAFCQQKGGAGKSTLAINIATAAEAHGEHVLVVDLDLQGSAMFWAERRGGMRPTVIAGLPERLPDIVKAAGELGVTLVVIDVPSRLDDVALAAVRAASLIVCPCKTDLLSLHPLRQTVDLLVSAEKLQSAIAVLNDLDESGAAKMIARARETLEEFGLAVTATAIGHSPSFAKAYDNGRAVTELKPAGGKAASQIELLWADLNDADSDHTARGENTPPPRKRRRRT